MKVVVLGYTGLIGSYVIEYLIKKTGYDIICVGRDIERKPYKNSRVKYVNWDFNSFKKSNLFFLEKVNIIVNCAGKSNENKKKLEKINYLFLKKLIRYINTNKFKVRLVHLSSVAVYGRVFKNFGQKKIISENSPIKINDIYSKTKFKGDILIQNVSSLEEIRNSLEVIRDVHRIINKLVTQRINSQDIIHLSV